MNLIEFIVRLPPDVALVAAVVVAMAATALANIFGWL
jgi:hypothetical protein